MRKKNFKNNFKSFFFFKFLNHFFFIYKGDYEGYVIETSVSVLTISGLPAGKNLNLMIVNDRFHR